MNRVGGELNLKTAGLDRMVLGSARISIVASAEHIASLRGQAACEWLGNAQFLALESDGVFDPAALGSCDVAVVEVDPASQASLARIRQIKQFDPDLPLAVAIASSNVKTVRTLVKAGVDDVVALPLDAEEILQTVLAIIEVKAERSVGNARLAPVITVCRAMGGCGSTSVATHLAAALADRDAPQANVCILDLDLQYGRVAETVGLTPRRTLDDLLAAGNRLDAAVLRSVAVSHQAGFAVVGAPAEIGPIEAVDIDVLGTVLRAARREFDYVIVDMPSDITNWGLSVISSADQVLMVVEPKVTAIRQARRRLDLFRNLGLDLRLVSIVLNKAENRMFGLISNSAIEESLHRPIDMCIRDDSKTLPVAQEQGLLAQEWRSKSTFWADIVKLAEQLRTGRLAGFLS